LQHWCNLLQHNAIINAFALLPKVAAAAGSAFTSRSTRAGIHKLLDSHLQLEQRQSGGDCRLPDALGRCAGSYFCGGGPMQYGGEFGQQQGRSFDMLGRTQASMFEQGGNMDVGVLSTPLTTP
jgi:hypothetical protein